MDPAGAAEFSTIIVRNESGSYGLGDDRQPPEQPRHEPLEERTTSFDNAGLLVHHQQQQLIFESCQQQKNDDDTTRQPDHSKYLHCTIFHSFYFSPLFTHSQLFRPLSTAHFSHSTAAAAAAIATQTKTMPTLRTRRICRSARATLTWRSRSDWSRPLEVASSPGSPGTLFCRRPVFLSGHLQAWMESTEQLKHPSGFASSPPPGGR